MTPSKKSRKSQGPNRKNDPDNYLNKSPSWCFLSCDIDETFSWSFTNKKAKEDFWTKIFPKLRDFERMTWNEIETQNKKRNHRNFIDDMNKEARNRLEDLEIEVDALMSLRLSGKVRIYGYREDSVFHLVWYDNNHGDNDSCVVKSNKKHT